MKYNSVNDPMLLGIVPARLLLPSSVYVNDVNNPILLGIVPCRLLPPRFKYVNDDNDPILLGIVPTNARLDNKICVTLAYVADPLIVPHVTP